jgi:hypothetical protein
MRSDHIDNIANAAIERSPGVAVVSPGRFRKQIRAGVRLVGFRKQATAR